MTYTLLDSGYGQKLEQFGPYTLIRPCAQAVWHPHLPESEWKRADGTFSRESGDRWRWSHQIPSSWEIAIDGISFHIQPTEFGHVGVFPEQCSFWKRVPELLSPHCRILNLFAYSGGSTLACARAGASVCHLDASKGMVQWARENAALNTLQNTPIRWIVEDVMKFLTREKRRESRYEGIILDPPSFGRGAKGEVFKIEETILPLLSLCRDCLSNTPRFIFFSCHTPGFTPIVLRHLLEEITIGGTIECGEMVLEGNTPSIRSVPSGAYALWRHP